MVNISLVILDGCVSVASFPTYVISSPPLHNGLPTLLVFQEKLRMYLGLT